ncbi:MAG: hypothetical protein GY828_02295 [Candidatus Gracilibacteria bacterium]|nr:hypothetical protein [Candidatus Gracilibacteria bacterium]
MNNKENILSILKSLWGKWDLAEGIYIVVEKTNNTNLVNDLLVFFSLTLNNVDNYELKTKIQESIDILHKMKQEEGLDKNTDIEEADNLIYHL